MSVTVRNFTSTDLTPTVKSKKLQHLIPTVLTAKKIECDINNVSVAVANGLRRTCASEITGRSMTFDEGDFETNNPFILMDFLKTRINHIPIKQDIANGVEFYINKTNDTKTVMTVYSSDIKVKGNANKGAAYFNTTFPVITLQPDTSITIKRIYIQSGLGYIDSSFCLACQSACVPLDQTPVDLETNIGVRSGVADPRKHRVSFVTNGGIGGKEILIRGCQSIRERLRYIQTLLPTITTKDDTSMLVINGESDTIGNLLLKTVIEETTNVIITYETDSTYRALTIKLKTQEEPDKIINSAIKSIIKIYETIEKEVR